MVMFPVRKCYHVAKVAALLVLVLTILTLFEQWRGGKRTARAQFSNPDEEEFERQILEDEARIIPGLGEGGAAAHLVGEDKRLGEESEKKLAINVYLSDRIAYNRSLKDYRNPACGRVLYDAELPSASVILIFHNEPYSVVVRTIWSVVNSARRDNPWFQHANFVERDTGRTMNIGYPGQDPSSPFVYLKEIILVDDNSTLPELKGKLSHYVRTRLPPDLIRILRLPDRVGLTRARLAGARYAVGDALVFLDSHCEGQRDWLRPLLHKIKISPHSVVVPIIDVIDSSNFYYSVQDSVSFQVGGFTFMGHFTWVDVPEREKKRRGSDIAPTWSPTMAGGLFAINRAYYWELGAYDEQMAGWGGENLEMSFRIWQCGGTLETIPCSRVGHVFRSFHPYGLPAHTDTHGINTARMAEVWMDDYAELFYLHRPDLRNNPKIGDVTHRKVLREKLKCKSFQWYLDNIYKEKFVPVRDVYGFGRFMNPTSGLCLDTMQREGEASPLGVYSCHSTLQATQYLSLSLAGQLRDEEKCAQLHYNRREPGEQERERRVLMVTCHGKQRAQQWRHLSSGQIQHVESGLCLDAGFESGADALAKPCRAVPEQKWDIDYSEENDFRMANDVEPSEQEIRLKRLRGQRRISRSLLSFSEERENTTVRRHTHKNKRKRRKHAKKRAKLNKRSSKKNKFILKVVRTLQNGSEEHLEVDIHCKHKQLYPNNTFVRKLVTLLNDNDIKIINNGRVFEKNKVTELAKESRNKQKLSIAQTTTDTEIRTTTQTKRWRQKKHKHAQPRQPIDTNIDNIANIASLANADPMANMEPLPNAPLTATTPDEKKIIIEDFVEVRPMTTTPAKHAPKKRKRKRPHMTSLPVLREHPPANTEAPRKEANDEDADTNNLLALLTNKHAFKEVTVNTPAYSEEERMISSAEEAPMMMSKEAKSDKDGDIADNALERDDDTATDEDWPIGESRFRRNSTSHNPRRSSCSHDARRSRTHAHTDMEDNQPSQPPHNSSDSHQDLRSGDQPPVKLVMRSNLTFNLGDEFFEWKRRATDDVANLLNELSIPSNHSRMPPAIHAWLQPEETNDIRDTNDVHDTNDARNDGNDARNDANDATIDANDVIRGDSRTNAPDTNEKESSSSSESTSSET